MLYNKFILKNPFFISGMKNMKNFIIFLGKFWDILPDFSKKKYFKAFKGRSKGLALV